MAGKKSKGPMQTTLSRNLTKRIKDSGKSQAEIAAEVGIKPSSLSSYCTGERFPRATPLRALADYFNISVGELTDDETTRSRARAALSPEAAVIASQYDELDAHGRALLRMVMDAELERVRGKK
jgi:transcriptional regulator with XRE-family HTH domain